MDTQVVPHISAPSRVQSGTSEQSTEPATPRKAIAWFSPADDAPRQRHATFRDVNRPVREHDPRWRWPAQQADISHGVRVEQFCTAADRSHRQTSASAAAGRAAESVCRDARGSVLIRYAMPSGNDVGHIRRRVGVA